MIATASIPSGWSTSEASIEATSVYPRGISSCLACATEREGFRRQHTGADLETIVQARCDPMRSSDERVAAAADQAKAQPPSQPGQRAFEH
jgi:hypothetical protein